MPTYQERVAKVRLFGGTVDLRDGSISGITQREQEAIEDEGERTYDARKPLGHI